ncbi:MAG: hypothetical protein P1V18_01050 [Candidatus Gracilibacteria bacterium]|nr:hypothetical protein [Candidatus Gracilibacteria bacterium]
MKTLYVDIDEEVSELISKIVALKGQQVLLVIPKEAQIFSNSINLKILKKKSDEDKKQLKIFTNDEKGKVMIQKAGLKLYQGSLRKRNTSRSAHLGHLPGKEVKKQEQKRVSITQIAQQKGQKTIHKAMSAPQRKKKRKQQKDWAQFFFFNTLKKRTTIGFTVITLMFFLIVVYIAIPSATIYLTPATNVVEKTINITFAEPSKNRDLFRQPNTHIIPSLALNETHERQMVYRSTGKIFTGSSSRCNLKVTNERTSAWTLVSKTRFQSPTKEIFRLKENIQVPAARYEIVRDAKGNAERQKINGSLIVSVEADEKDEDGNIIGVRGNLLENTPFILPGLSPFNQTLLSATNEKACQGGTTESYNVVTEDDISASQEKIKELLRGEGKQILQDSVTNKNLKRAQQENEEMASVQLKFFDNPRAINYEVTEVTVPENIEGTRAEEFSVSGKIKAMGIAYEEPSYFEILEEGLVSKIHPNKVLSSIDYDSTTYNIVYSDSDLDSLSKIKISVTVRGLEEFNFDPRSDTGEELISRVMGYIPGKEKNEALYFISNLEEIQKAHISIWPFWKQEIPSRTSSITVKVR